VWKEGFDEKDTRNGTFHLLDGKNIQTPMMYQQGNHYLPYFENDEFQAVSLPYLSTNITMNILLPRSAKFPKFENSLDYQKLLLILQDINDWNPARGPLNITLKIPKFKFESSYKLVPGLSELGMKEAFEVGADFSGMTGSKGLVIGDVKQKTLISVDEKGTEAAASTGIVGVTGIEKYQPVDFIADHPFIFLVRDSQTGTILFMGRVLNPQG
jgi:serpin B